MTDREYIAKAASEPLFFISAGPGDIKQANAVVAGTTKHKHYKQIDSVIMRRK